MKPGLARALREESLAYHAARLLIVIRYCGSPQRSIARSPGVKGRTLLAKLDFFVRYPLYLEKASALRSRQLGKPMSVPASGSEGVSVESHMVRYLYGPWDHLYFSVLAYLVGKRMIRIELDRGVEVFRIAPQGLRALEKLIASPQYAGFVERAKATASLFPNFGGTKLKTFIYENFPEVIGRQVGALI
jgi:hypothetical protein